MNAQEKIIVEQKGYFTVEQVDELCNYIVELVKSDKRFKAENGKDGAPGMHGKDGASAFRGIDYWTKADKQEIIAEVLKLTPKPRDGKDGVSPNAEELVKKIKAEPFDINKILNNPQLRMLLRGGGVSAGNTVVWEGPQRTLPRTLTSSGGTAVVDFSLANNYTITLTENTNFTTLNIPSGSEQSGVITILGGGSSYNVTFSTTWKAPAAAMTATFTVPAAQIDETVYLTKGTYISATYRANIS